MRVMGAVTLTVAALVGGATATAAAQPQSPLDVIEQLEFAGYWVNVDRVGSAPIEECVVTSVRNPQQITVPAVLIDDGPGHFGGKGDERDVVDVVVRQSISVSLDCAR